MLGKKQLVPIQGNVSVARYRDEIIQPDLLPDIDIQGEISQQENARPDTTHLTMDYLQNQEHCCDSMTVKIVRIKFNRTANPSGATTNIYEYEWQIIQQVRIHERIESLSRRVHTLWQINGGHNRY